MSTYTIYHNPRCSKSRQTLAMLNERGIEPEIVDTLSHLCQSVSCSRCNKSWAPQPLAMIRSKEQAFKIWVSMMDSPATHHCLRRSQRILSLERPMSFAQTTR